MFKDSTRKQTYQCSQHEQKFVSSLLRCSYNEGMNSVDNYTAGVEQEDNGDELVACTTSHDSGHDRASHPITSGEYSVKLLSRLMN